MKKTEDSEGGMFSSEAPVHYSKVALIDPVDGFVDKLPRFLSFLHHLVILL